jgi:site-specific recombinase XerD
MAPGNARVPPEPERIPVEEGKMNGCIYVEDFMLFERAAGKAAATQRNHERALRRLSGWLVAQGKPEEEVTRSDLVAFVNSLVGHRNADYINQYISAMRVYFRWLQEEGLITADPAARLKFLAVPVRPVESLTEAECKKLVKWATTEAPRKRFGVHRTGVLSLLLLDTGMRIGEALRLTVADLHARVAEYALQRERIAAVRDPE